MVFFFIFWEGDEFFIDDDFFFYFIYLHSEAERNAHKRCRRRFCRPLLLD